eukprot:6491476-Amphidinium_carterae.1
MPMWKSILWTVHVLVTGSLFVPADYDPARLIYSWWQAFEQYDMSVISRVFSSDNEDTTPGASSCCKDPGDRPSWWKTSDKTPPLKQHPAGGSELYSLEHYDYYYYYLESYTSWYHYSAYWEQPAQVCECNLELGHGMGWKTQLAVTMALLALVGGSILVVTLRANWWIQCWLGIGTTVVRVWGLLLNGIRMAYGGVRADITRVSQAFTFMVAEVLFVMSRRLPCLRARLRRTVMRIRPYAAASTITGEPVRMFSPETARTPRPLLNEILLDRGLVLGGRLMGRTRLKQIRHRGWRTSYNPQGTRGDCLFMVLMRLLHVKATPMQFRRLLQQHARILLKTNESIHGGMSLAQHLARASIPQDAFIQDLAGPRRRWGNTFDVMTCAHLYRRRMRLTSVASGKILFDAQFEGKPLDVGYTYKHFVAGSRRSDRRHGQGGRNAAGLCIYGWLMTGLASLVIGVAGCYVAWPLCRVTPDSPEAWQNVATSCTGTPDTPEAGNVAWSLSRLTPALPEAWKWLSCLVSIGAIPGYSFSSTPDLE